jgi:CRP-like cAMP-binding protein
MSDIDLIRQIPIFAGLSESGLGELAASMEWRHFPAGSLIVEEDAPGHELFLIKSGRVEVVRHLGKADETRLVILEARDFFGEMSLIEAMGHSASVRAMEHCDVLVLRSGDLYRLFQHQQDQYAIVILNIARDLCRRLRALDDMYTGKTHG